MPLSPAAPSAPGRRPFDAVLCDVDNVIRVYDPTHLYALERAAGLAEGTTMKVAFAPDTVLPLVLGRITPDEWAWSILRGLTGLVSDVTAAELSTALARSPSTPTRQWWRCCAGPGRGCRWSS